jgi:uncharacterized protein (TIGR00255 family)
MIISMTGYGLGVSDWKGMKVRVEIKSLNARTSEVRCKLPVSLRDKELEVRQWVLNELHRGKIDINIIYDESENANASLLNKVLFRRYYQELSSLKSELGISEGDIIQSIMRIPSVLSTGENLSDEEEWVSVRSALHEALLAIQKYRIDEGRVLSAELQSGVHKITELLHNVTPLESGRIVRMKDRLRKLFDEYLTGQQVDQNRFEQELIYYIEKLDISEEKVRLAQHCQYFLDELGLPEPEKGRKLGFIAQEMGREINTMGAKAQDSDIQFLVVAMKDELEKIKEQLANIL